MEYEFWKFQKKNTNLHSRAFPSNRRQSTGGVVWRARARARQATRWYRPDIRPSRPAVWARMELRRRWESYPCSSQRAPDLSKHFVCVFYVEAVVCWYVMPSGRYIAYRCKYNTAYISFVFCLETLFFIRTIRYNCGSILDMWSFLLFSQYILLKLFLQEIIK